MLRFKDTIFHWFTAVGLLLTGLSAMPAVAADRLIDAVKVGAVGDGVTVNTVSIQKAIDDCAAAGGGMISFPAGRYLTGTIQLKSNVTLRLEKEATLLGSTEVADYRNIDPFIDGSGNPSGACAHSRGGCREPGHRGPRDRGWTEPQVESQAEVLHDAAFLLRWVRCTNVTVRDVHLTNPGAWTLNFFRTKGALIEGVAIRSRGFSILAALGDSYSEHINDIPSLKLQTASRTPLGHK
ncbi:glycosyl hydrolase family 28-related protein [Verrucomicrobiota bacterium sgz303538]